MKSIPKRSVLRDILTAQAALKAYGVARICGEAGKCGGGGGCKRVILRGKTRFLGVNDLSVQKTNLTLWDRCIK